MVAESATELLANNDIILNLNDPCQIEDTSWIKPGTIMRVTQLSTEAAKNVVDFAAERGLDYIHFDAGWYGPEASKTSDPRKPIGSGPGESRESSSGSSTWVHTAGPRGCIRPSADAPNTI